MDAPGSLLAQRYELREQIGVGGAGAVYRASDHVLDRDVAVKLLRTVSDADARARLRLEARLSAALAHPGIVRVHDYGEEGEGPASAPYLVMEYVDGRSLRDVLAERGTLPAEQVLSIVAQVADALAAAHAAGIVHRDVKPGNILVRPDGTVALVDFGIARALDVEPLTLTGTIVGTVDYISPEQADGRGATPLSDLYSLGMVAYECLTGVRPLRRDTQVSTLMAHLTEDVPPLRNDVPHAVRRLVARLVARDPRRRPVDAAAAAREARAALAAPGSATSRSSQVIAGVWGRSRRRRWATVGALAAAVLVFAYVLASPGAAPQPGAGTPADAATTGVDETTVVTRVSRPSASASPVSDTTGDATGVPSRSVSSRPADGTAAGTTTRDGGGSGSPSAGRKHGPGRAGAHDRRHPQDRAKGHGKGHAKGHGDAKPGKGKGRDK